MGNGASSKNGREGGGGGSTMGAGKATSKGSGKRGLVYRYGGRKFDTLAFLGRKKPKRQNAYVGETTTSVASGEEVYKPPEVTSVDITTNLLRIRDEHHTNEYEASDLIVRRGQPFVFSFTLERPYNEEKDTIYLEFGTGIKPTMTKGTCVQFPITKELDEGKWCATFEKQEGNEITIKARPSYNCPVGRWSIAIILKSLESKTSQTRFHYDRPIYILFNPWCQKDAVYMEKEDEREEFVLEDSGYLWYGSYKQIGKRRWNFGQFEDSALEAAIYLLQDQEHPLPCPDRGNPILVSRKMSAAINSQDDGGVLVGRWDGNYDDGTRPTAWNGSVQILEQYMKEKDPVCYGQCWVFSGVLTTVLRTLGIPARSVTNYASAHDTDGSMTIDKHLDESGEPIEWMDSDSVWNFHVWNDCWMTRPDLPPGYGGWQAVDATPQETSEGIFQAGPASLDAIKQGHVYLPYDTRFIFAEINGDMVYWEATNGDYYLGKIRCEPSSVGRHLYTKSLRKNEGEDIKQEYKHPEGSAEERLAVENAVQHGSKPDTYCPDGPNSDDVQFDIDTIDRVYVGSDFDVKIKLTNKSAEERNVSLSVIIQVCYYTGVLAERIKTEKKQVTLDANSGMECSVHVNVEEYVDKLVDQSAMKIFFMGKVKETNQVMAAQDDFRLRTPDVDLVVSETKLKVGQEFSATMALKNPLPRTLTNCTFCLEGAGLQRMQTIYLNDIPENGEVKEEVTLKARKPGRRTLVAGFDSDQLSQVHSDVSLEVTKE